MPNKADTTCIGTVGRYTPPPPLIDKEPHEEPSLRFSGGKIKFGSGYTEDSVEHTFSHIITL